MKKIYTLACACLFASTFCQAQQSTNKFAANVRLAGNYAEKNDIENALLYVQKLVDSGFSNFVFLDTSVRFSSL
ncbi:MAG TPA: hypothetical protein VJT83_01395, partial [Chitinophagaceae bacterium]|nr:hypothetical protein [Chitinophagaceae bacterium]